jgi:uncharacterized protein
VVYPVNSINISRDPKDNILLECCVKSRADYLITGDRDLLDIKELAFPLKIISPRDFLNIQQR